LSAFAVVYKEKETPGLNIVFNKIMEHLAHRGPDGSNTFASEKIAIGHWHFWTTPEETGEKQPLSTNNCQIVFDGRIDNRGELCRKLNISASDESSISDANLTLLSYEHWKNNCVKQFIGEFAFVIYDKQQDKIFSARDPLGERTLFYAFNSAQLLIASEPWAISAALTEKPDINECAVTHYFALSYPENGQTLFQGIYELLPAHSMILNDGNLQLYQYWSPDPRKKIRYKTDEEYAAQFRLLLEESVRCRMRCAVPFGILMSGGLDSTSIACLTARASAPQQVTTISYVFDELSECDERKYINDVTAKWNTHSIHIPCDDVWTYKDWQDWKFSLNYPIGNPYRLILQRVYERTNREGIRVLLTGLFGDHLYAAGTDWIADLILDGHLLEAIKELKAQANNKGWKKVFQTQHIRRILRRALDLLMPGKIRLPHSTRPPEWIRQYQIRFLRFNRKRQNPVFERNGQMLQLTTSAASAYECFLSNHYAIEIRNPYRDIRLIEFALAIPAHQLYFRGHYKHILRTAMKGILPESIRTRVKPTTFISLFMRGIERESEFIRAFFENKKSDWMKYISAEWMNDVQEDSQRNSRIKAYIAFMCISYQTWSNLLKKQD
jgi:asparagine synthase (glutamine-hydrolysing)